MIQTVGQKSHVWFGNRNHWAYGRHPEGSRGLLASHLPPALTDRQRLAVQFIRFVEKQRGTKDAPGRENPGDYDLTR